MVPVLLLAWARRRAELALGGSQVSLVLGKVRNTQFRRAWAKLAVGAVLSWGQRGRRLVIVLSSRPLSQ